LTRCSGLIDEQEVTDKDNIENEAIRKRVFLSKNIVLGLNFVVVI
jgi:predicted amidohydrolase